MNKVLGRKFIVMVDAIAVFVNITFKNTHQDARVAILRQDTSHAATEGE